MRAKADGDWGPLKPDSPQAESMTQPVSSGARWPHTDMSCSESSDEERETFTCDETHTLRCASGRAQLATAPNEEPAEHDVTPWGLAFCRDADTVIEGFLCNEPTVVSNACRKPNNAFDEFVCDEPKMHQLQWGILKETWSVVKSIALGLLRGKL